MAHTEKIDIHSMGNDAADKLANKSANEIPRTFKENIFFKDNDHNKHNENNEEYTYDSDNSIGDIQINELLDLEVSDEKFEEIDKKISKNNKKIYGFKNTKLSNWFIKK
jgi:hypothetical protein